MIHRIIAFCCILLTLVGCGEKKSNKSTSFEKQYVYFELPSGWQISEQDSSEQNYYSVSMEMMAEDASGFAFIEWNDSLFSLEEVMDSTKQSFLSSEFFQNAAIEFDAPQAGQFAGQTALISYFSFNLQGLDYQGRMHSFQLPACNKTMMVIFQEQQIDSKLQQSDFEWIEKSIRCKQ